mgnify:CR=1 FL=1
MSLVERAAAETVDPAREITARAVEKRDERYITDTDVDFVNQHAV